eukprot:scaffold294478_cov35-Tisochrysis_lutea.AAC.3
MTGGKGRGRGGIQGVRKSSGSGAMSPGPRPRLRAPRERSYCTAIRYSLGIFTAAVHVWKP